MNAKQKTAVLGILVDTLQDLSGLGPDEIEKDATFLELGFDSLFLTQLATGFKKATKVDIAFRQLMADAPTLSELANYVMERNPDLAASAAEVPVEAPAPQQETAPVDVVQTANLPVEQPQVAPAVSAPIVNPVEQFTWQSSAPGDYGNIDSTGLEAIVAEQLRVMEHQLSVLAALGRSGATTAPVITGKQEKNEVAEEKLGTSKTGTEAEPQSEKAVAPQPDAPDTDESKTVPAGRSAGPWKPANTTGAGEISDLQANALASLAKRYIESTKKSKSYTQEHRPHFADARAVSGFQREWKEMVYPLVAEKSSGSYIWDIDGNRYIDMTMGFGSALFGHSPEFITKALQHQLTLGVEIGPQSALAGEVARKICKMASVERVGFCNTGSEAVLVAVRVARTVTGRDKIAVFEGDYHGIFDEVLARAGRNESAMPISPGIPRESLGSVVVFNRKDKDLTEKIKQHADDLAAVLIEPVAGRAPGDQSPELLKELRTATQEAGIPLIFDEVITGFRLGQQGARGEFGVDADIVTFGKAVGGGMPIGIVAGKAEYLDALDGGEWHYGDDSVPEKGMTFFAGTFVRHPLAMAAATAVIDELERQGPDFYTELNGKAEQFTGRLNSLLARTGAPLFIERCGSLLHLTFVEKSRFDGLFYYFLRENGVHIWESRPVFVAVSHTVHDLQAVLNAFERSIEQMHEGGFWEPNDGGDSDAADVDMPEAASFPVRDRFPLTEGQQEIWLASRLSPDASLGFNEGFQLLFKGQLDRDALEGSLREIYSRHDSLRTTFDSEGAYQQVSPSLDLDFNFEDLTSLDNTSAEERVSEILDAEARTAFDLANGPLIRLCLVRTGEQEHVLSVCSHHIVFDGWAHGVFPRELAELYSASIEGRTPELPEPVQMSQLAGWMERHESSGVGKKAEQFWTEKFKELPEPLALPAKQSRTRITGHNSAIVRSLVPPELIARVKKLSARNGSTSFGLFLAAYKVLLARITGQKDITVGIGMSSASRSGADNIIGHCVSFLPIRTTVNRTPFVQHLKNVSTNLLDAYDHQGYTIGSLMKKLGVNSGKPPTPIVTALFNMDQESESVGFSDLELEHTALPAANFNHELFFNLWDGAVGLKIACEYSTDLFDHETVAGWLDAYCNILEQIVDDPSMPTDEFNIVDLTGACIEPAQKRVDSAQSVEVTVPTAAKGDAETVVSVFDEVVAQHPSSVAICDATGIPVTYSELEQRSDRLAGWLASRGCEAGDNIGLLMPRSVNLVVAMLATLKLGCAYVPIDPAQPTSRSRTILNDAATRLVLHGEISFDPATWDLPTVTFCNIHLAESEGSSVRIAAGEIHSESPAYVMYTSGSTGEPKGVVVPHRSIVNLVRNTNYIDMGPGNVIAHVSNTAFDAATFEIWGALLNGATIAIFTPDEVINPGRLGDLIRARSITSMFLTTALFNVMASELPGVFNSVRDVLFGGEPVDPAAVRSVIQNHPPKRLVHVYGPTEATTFSTWFEVNSVPANANTVPIGRPVSNAQALVLDDSLEPVPDGEVGHLYLAGAGLALGYLNSPALTVERFVKNPDSDHLMYKTGDLAKTNKDGEIEFIGRADSQVKLHGFRIEPGEIETAINRHSKVNSCAVIAWPETGERRLVVYIDASSPAPDTDELISHLEDLLPAYMIPSQVIFVDRLPVNANGKVDRSALPEPESIDHVDPVKQVGPASAVETQLAAMWEEILEYSPAGIHDSFFDMGGDSLRTATLFARIERLFDVSLPIEEFSGNPTIVNVASMISDRSTGPAREVPKLLTLNPDGEARTLFGADPVYNYIPLARHLGKNQPVSGPTPQPVSGMRTPSNSVEERAAYLVEELRKIQPTGPYDLCGHSAAGIVAYEMAQQFSAMGEQVSNLILFDPSNPDLASSGITGLVSAHLQRARSNGNIGLASYLPKLVTQKLTSGLGLHGKQDKNPDFKSMTRDELLEDLRATEGPMIRKYKPAVYTGNVTLILVEKPSDPGSIERLTNQWKRLIDGEIRVIVVQGEHNTMLKEPSISQIAQYVREDLEKRTTVGGQDAGVEVPLGVTS